MNVSAANSLLKFWKSLKGNVSDSGSREFRQDVAKPFNHGVKSFILTPLNKQQLVKQYKSMESMKKVPILLASLTNSYNKTVEILKMNGLMVLKMLLSSGFFI